ncbi:MAG: hypothetical protein IJ866_02925 [Alphaproteobacteria bacterium]|nr:hypothetical protein [Alphaproteobacteria bacterium]
MIKMSYDPIMGVRYVSVDVEPRNENQRVIASKATELYNRTRHARAKQLRRANNTKSK